MKKWLAVLAAAFGGLAACFWNADKSGSDGGADAAVGTIGDIFATSCALSGCHAGSSPQQGLDLSAGVFESNLVGVPSTEVLGKLRVVPGDHASSYLMCKIDPTCTPDVGDHMPLGSGLPQAQIDAIAAWIDSLPADAGISGDASDAGDTVPPTFAGVTNATTPVPNSITLSWTAATDDVSASGNIVYLVYQSTTKGGESYATPSYTTSPGATSFAVGNLGKGITYYFVVRAKDQAGNVDTNTNEVSATTLNISDTTPPTFGGATSATSASASSIQLGWTAATDDYTAAANIVYLVYDATTSGGESYSTPTWTTAAGATSFTATGLSAATKYYFVVRAKDQSGNIDANTKEVSATTSSVSYKNDIAPIFTQNCANAGCHTGVKPAESMNLSTASLAYSNLVNVASIECGADKRVNPGSPTTSYVMIKLLGSGTCFTGTQMPKTGGALPQTQIDLIGAWIGAGALNN
jgi:hypothetical protein